MCNESEAFVGYKSEAFVCTQSEAWVWVAENNFGHMGKSSYFCTLKSNMIMASDYSTEESQTPMASEPAAEYGTVAKRHLRVVSDEELASYMPLEESRRLITEKIYRFYHPEA